ncbi:MAG: M23 family metallopeptidase [Candidatus Krumholzibacteria bacterium]|nr:M23 family metallopeptidase [Candidatus Krumholzibacteria bacterium]
MKKGTFTVIIVHDDRQRTKQYRVSYRLFYALVVIVCVGTVAMVMFVATYGKLLIKAREAVLMERQITELTRRNKQVGELMRNLASLRTMNLQVRRMLGIDVSEEDSLAMQPDQARSGAVENGFPADQEMALYSTPSFWPVRGYITKGFSISSGTDNENYHPGIDIAVPRGTPVRAAAAGYVLESGWDDMYGYYVMIEHGYGIKTLYAHNDRLAVMKGERIGRGQTIGYSGNTGKSTAPHVHFEVIQNNNYVDPLNYLLQ